MPFDEVQHGEYDCLSAASLIFALERVVNGMHPNDQSGKREAKGELLYVTTRAIFALERVVNGMHSNDQSGTWDYEVKSTKVAL